MSTLNTVKIQRFSTHDGDGVRTVVFLKGCPLRCAWCHNPETQSAKPQIFFKKNSCALCGLCMTACKNHAHTVSDSQHIFDANACIGCHECASVCPYGAIEAVGCHMSIDEILSIVLRDKPFYGKCGGLTVSGGEPMLQPDGCLELLEAAKANGITTAIETCGYFDDKYVPRLASLCDHIIYDIKDGNSQRHATYTGVCNERIIDNLKLIDKFASRVLIRCIMVKGVNMDDKNYSVIAELFGSLRSCEGIELIPYHAYAGSKSVQLGGIDNGNAEWIPSDADMNDAKSRLTSMGCIII